MDGHVSAAIEHGDVSTARLRMHYRSHGAGGAMPILFVHGSFGTSRWWEPLLLLLPNEFHALAPDMRGCGNTDRADDGYSVESLAADLAAFVDAMGLLNFDLVAHASAGAVAVEYVLAHPEVARALVLVDSVPLEGVYTPLEALTLLDQMRTNPPLLADALAMLMPRFAAEDAAGFAHIVDDAAAMAPAAFTEIAVALGAWNRFADARALTLPTLLIWGDEDPIVLRAAMTRNLLAIPGANNLVVLRGVGHSPMLDAPLTLAEHIVDFVTEDFGGYSSIRKTASSD